MKSYFNRLLFLCELLALSVFSSNVLSNAFKIPDVFKGANLWVPRSYQSYHLLLLKAAEKVQANTYCHELISGTVSEQTSTKQMLIFDFRCRAEDGLMFSIQVDESMELKSHYIETRLAKEPEKKPDKFTPEDLRRMEREYWPICDSAIRKRLTYFDGLKVLTKFPLKMTVQDEELFIFGLDFNAKNLARKNLYYRMECQINFEKDYQLVIEPRKTKS